MVAGTDEGQSTADSTAIAISVATTGSNEQVTQRQPHATETAAARSPTIALSARQYSAFIFKKISATF